MREAIGGSLLLNLILVFTGLVILFFVGILAYSKAYRVKNQIIEVIEKHETYDTSVQAELNPYLKDVGYSATYWGKCEATNLNNPQSYSYCVYKKESTNTSGAYYYEVVTYVQFDFPIIGSKITIPVKGETKILGISYDY